LGLRKVKKEGFAVIKFGVNERGCNCAHSGKVESDSYPLKIFNLSLTLLLLLSPKLLNFITVLLF